MHARTERPNGRPTTGDERWLGPRYRPRRDVRLIPDPDAGLSLEVQAEIRETVSQILSERMLLPAIEDLGDDLMQRMMSVCLGEDVPHEYAQLNRDEMGIVSRVPEWRAPTKADVLARHEVLIVGVTHDPDWTENESGV